MFGSSAINKSGKKFAPKVPVRRRQPAPADAQVTSVAASASPSVEPHAVPDATPPATAPSQNLPESVDSLAEHVEIRSSPRVHRDTSAQEPRASSNRQSRSQDPARPNEPTQIASGGARTVEVEAGVERHLKRRRVQSPVEHRSSTQSTRIAASPTRESAVSSISSSQATPVAQDPRLESTNETIAAELPTPTQTQELAPTTTFGATTRDIDSTNQPLSARARGKRKATDTSAPDAEESSRVVPSAPTPKKPRKTRKDKGTTKKPKGVSTTLEGGAETTESAPPEQNVPLESEFSLSGALIRAAEQNRAKRDRRPAQPVTSSTIELRTRRRGKRAGTPDDADERKIDITTNTMGSITHDRRIGKISEREKLMRTIDWDEVRKKRQEQRANAKPRRRGPTPERDPNQENNDEQESEAGPSTAPIDRVRPTQQQAQVRIVNGVLVTDETTLVIDRRANLQSSNAMLETVEESDLTASLNTQSWLNANKRDVGDNEPLYTPTDRWSTRDTDAFYEALRMFGTDFSIISHMFPGRTRRNIKHKFVKEERSDPARIKAALNGEKVTMDFQTYLNNTGQTESDFKDPRALEEELKLEDERHKAEVEDVKKQYEETQKQRKLAEGAGGGGDGGQAGAQGEAAKKGRRKKKGKNETRGGEDVEVLGTIDD